MNKTCNRVQLRRLTVETRRRRMNQCLGESVVASVCPWFETKPSGRVTGRRSELQPNTWEERSAPEEKLQRTTVILVAVPAASALISSLPQPGTRAKRIIPPGQVAWPTYPLLFHSTVFCLRSTKISCELDISCMMACINSERIWILDNIN